MSGGMDDRVYEVLEAIPALDARPGDLIVPDPQSSKLLVVRRHSLARYPDFVQNLDRLRPVSPASEEKRPHLQVVPGDASNPDRRER